MRMALLDPTNKFTREVPVESLQEAGGTCGPSPLVDTSDATIVVGGSEEAVCNQSPDGDAVHATAASTPVLSEGMADLTHSSPDPVQVPLPSAGAGHIVSQLDTYVAFCI